MGNILHLNGSPLLLGGVDSFLSGAASGNATITTREMGLLNSSRPAPWSVFFKASVSPSWFDVSETSDPDFPGQAMDWTSYNPQHHKLIYLWDFGEGYTFPLVSASSAGVPSAWANSRYARGPVVSHTYKTPGTYTARVVVIEPATGKIATGQTEITVDDPDTVFSGTDTICVNLFGDSDFTGAPQGAVEHNLGSGEEFEETLAIWTSNNQSGNDKRWLFKGGSSFPLSLTFNNGENGGVYLGSYGTGKAIWTPVSTYDDFLNQKAVTSSTFRYIITGIEARGGYDPSSSTVQEAFDAGNTVGDFFADGQGNTDVIIDDCTIKGILFGVTNLQFGADPDDQPAMWVMNDCRVTDYGGQYPIITGGNTSDDSWFAITGSDLSQNTDAYGNDDSSAASRAIVRINRMEYTHIAQNIFFEVQNTNTTVKVCWNTGDGTLTNFSDNYVEGVGNDLLNVGAQAVNVSTNYVKETIIDGNIFVSPSDTGTPVNVYALGVTLRNNVVFRGEHNIGTTTVSQFINFIKETSQSAEAPVRCFNNSFQLYLTDTENGSLDPDVGMPAFTYTIEADNLRYMPNYSPPVQTYTNLDTTTVLASPIYTGYTPKETGVLDTSVAGSPDVVTLRPETGSTAIDAASGANATGPELGADLGTAFAERDTTTNPEAGAFRKA